MVTLMSSKLKRLYLKGHYHKGQEDNQEVGENTVNLTRDCISAVHKNKLQIVTTRQENDLNG